jgi:hypothetical protein
MDLIYSKLFLNPYPPTPNPIKEVFWGSGVRGVSKSTLLPFLVATFLPKIVDLFGKISFFSKLFLNPYPQAPSPIKEFEGGEPGGSLKVHSSPSSSHN